MTHEGVTRDWTTLIEAAAEELGRCETALRIVLPVIRAKIPFAEVSDG